ncbi:MAG: hypothetical protein QM811_32030, partial [Pirellulales bacterium]
MDWYFTSGAINHSWYENGSTTAVGTRTFGENLLSGAAVTIAAQPSLSANALTLGPLLLNAPLPAATNLTLTNAGGPASASTATLGGTNPGKFTATNPGAIGATGTSAIGLASGTTSTAGTFNATVTYSTTPTGNPTTTVVPVSVTVGNATFSTPNSATLFGTPLTATIASNEVVANLASSTIAGAQVGAGNPAALGTTATILTYSNNSGEKIVSMAWRTRTSSEASVNETNGISTG